MRPQRADRVVNFVRSKAIGDLTEYGLPVPEEGTFSRLHRLARRAGDHRQGGRSRRSGERRIEIVAGVESLDETGAGLADGARIEPDAVIAATGYRRGLEPMVGHLGVLDDDGAPRAFAARRQRPACASSATSPARAAALRGREATRAAKAIAGELRRAGAATSAAQPARPPFE